MNWFEKLIPSRIRTEGGTKKAVPEGLWEKCKGCGAVLYRSEAERNMDVCPKCSYHNRINARRRLDLFLDSGDRVEIAGNLTPQDPLRFKDSKKYKDRLVAAQKATDENDAIVVMEGKLHGMDIVAAAFEFSFMGGSMGAVVGERFVRGANVALEKQIPLVCFSASGGARVQESLFSLMQMAKTSAALAKMREHGIPFISVMTDPTMGGVSASLAMLGDINAAEPDALIGFAGPRVIEQTVREKLPEGFQRSEFLLEHGAIDMIIDRRDMRDRLHRILTILRRETRVSEEAPDSEEPPMLDASDVIDMPDADEPPRAE